jgi:geranylgeranyl pyrophosphate synthase
MTNPSNEDDAIAITSYIDNFLRKKIIEADHFDQLQSELIQAIQELVHRGGKRMRPRLSLLAYAAFNNDGRPDKTSFMPVAASQELLHAFLLMHDDIIDRDTERWGGPNISGKYAHLLKDKMSLRQALHLAESSALIAGDLCHAFAQEMILSSPYPPELLLGAARILQQTVFETMAGEVVDMHLPSLPWLSVSKQRIMAVSTHKTARYSFCTPLMLGALFAGANTTQMQLLENFGLQLGTAFQLKDDILGMFGDPLQLGKPVLSDMQEGKRTLLTYYAYRAASKQQIQILSSCVGNPSAGYKELAIVQEILLSTGSVHKTENTLQKYIHASRQEFIKIAAELPDSEALKELENMIDSADQRTS